MPNSLKRMRLFAIYFTVSVALINAILLYWPEKEIMIWNQSVDRFLLNHVLGGLFIACLGFYFSIVFKSKIVSLIFYLLSFAIWSNAILIFLSK